MDSFSQRERSRIMACVRSTGNKSTELRLVILLKRERLNGWRRNYPLTGKPDFVFPKNKLAVFIDGCFWHGCPRCYRRPSSRRDYWDAKVQRNIARDIEVKRALKHKGWTVFRIWEHELKTSPEKILKNLKQRLDSRALISSGQNSCSSEAL